MTVFFSRCIIRFGQDEGGKEFDHVFRSSFSLERSVTSGYNGSKISGSQHFLLTETAICIVERWKESIDYCFFS